MKDDRTLSAVKRQLKAMECGLYYIGIYDENKGMINEVRNDYQIVSDIQYFKAMNWKGNNIYIKPALDDHALILVDDVKKDGIEILKRSGFEPACVVETSPKNYQAWVKAERPLGPDTRKQIACHLCDLVSGDPGSVDAKHYGRLAGFTNRKEKYRGENGRFPFVLCRASSGQIASKLIGLPAVEIKKPEKPQPPKIKNSDPANPDQDQDAHSTFREAWVTWEKSQTGDTMDLSSGDLSAASKMVRAGYSHDQIADAMRACSPRIEERKKGHIDDYIRRTVQRAFQKPEKKTAYVPLRSQP